LLPWGTIRAPNAIVITIHLCPVREVKEIGLNLSLCYSCFATNNLKQRRFKPWPIVTHSFILC
jgi:hypothetical protein